MSEPGVAITRRREARSPSARSLLLTVLGEFVHPRAKAVWTATFLEALGTLGVAEKSARQALTRTANEGLIASTRHGRRVLWQLTPTGTELLEEGTRRIYAFMQGRRTWDGRWMVLSLPIPEKQRQLRHRLRTRLTWLGLGSPAAGLWATPDASKEAGVHAVVRELGLEGRALGWLGLSSGISDEARLLGNAWDLADVEDRYLDFIDGFEVRCPTDALETFVAQVELVHAWRRFPFVDPDLPGELLDHDWPGPRAARAFHERHDRWHRQAQAEWDRMDRAAGGTP